MNGDARMTRVRISTEDREAADFDPTWIPLKCWICNHKHTMLVKLSDCGRTPNRAGVCTNPDCFRYTNPANLQTWVRE